MKNAKQIVFILIGTSMIFLCVCLILMRNSMGTENTANTREYGAVVYEEPINSLVFEAGACSVEVVRGEDDEYLLTYDGLKYGNLTHRLEDGELRISYTQENGWTAKLFVEDDVDNQKITLTVPKDAVLDRAVFEFGAAEIDMDRIEAKEIYITVGAGELNADRFVATEHAVLKVGAGAFYADNVKLTNAELECGVGEMNISGTIDGKSTAECGVGALELGILGEQDDYYGELNCGLGKVHLGDIRIKEGENKSYGTSSAEHRMDIKCGIGKVDVYFQN